ncbi:hypothetical protein Q9966_014880 [Columba livia]|nr:hypothetical protein Q9966_014880 [Columba livia]
MPEAAAYLVQAVRAAGRCDAVFRGFSDCLLRLGDNMAKYPQDLDDKRNLQTICTGSVHPLLWGRCAFLWLMMMMVVVVADDGETPM